MSDNQVMRAWEERIISQEKGGRIFHYILKDSTGNSLLAVIGRERSKSHLLYAISDEFLRVYGSTSTVHSRTKWQSRRDVVEWLVSIVSRNGPIGANSTNPSTLKRQITQQIKNRQASTEEEAKGSAPEEHTKQPSKGIKRCTFDHTLETSLAGPTNSLSENHKNVKSEPPCKTLKIKPASKAPTTLQLAVPDPQSQISSKLTTNIELLSQDNGMQGCWFRCKILRSSQRCLKVQYKDVPKVGEPGKLEEWIPAYRVATPDKLSVRRNGRLTIRPRPCNDSSETTFVVGAAVDAWWCNGWWEGVVIGYHTLAKRNLQVYFPGENRFLTVERKNIRVSRDWINSKWVNIEAKPNILSFLSSIFSMKLHPLDANSSALGNSNSKVLKPEQLQVNEDDKRQIPISSTLGNLKADEGLNFKKRFISRYNENLSRSSG